MTRAWAALASLGLDVDAFMLMYADGQYADGQLWAFKHRETRRYVFIPIPGTS